MILFKVYMNYDIDVKVIMLVIDINIGYLVYLFRYKIKFISIL